MNYVVAAQAYQAANGKVLLFSNWGWLDLLGGGFQPSLVVQWDPVAGTSTLRHDEGGGGLVSMSADHSKILIGGQGIPQLYDSAQDTFTAVPTVGYEPAMNPAGTQFAFIGGSPLIQFFNSQMQIVGTVDLPLCCGLAPFGGVYSPDGRYLYVMLPIHPPELVTVDTSTFTIVGTAPGYFSGTTVGHPQAADSSGLVFELADHGVAMDDSTNFHDLSKAEMLSTCCAITPDEGPLNTATMVKFTTQSFGSLPDVFFGGERALNPYFFNGADQLAATAPPSSTIGPVNVKALEASGSMAFVPQGFVYGIVPVEFGLLASSPNGNVVADLFGYGFYGDEPGANTQVNFGSASSTVETNGLVSAQIGYPFPLQHLQVKVPSGVPGAQSITVTSPAGTGTFANGFRYVTSVVDYPASDSFNYVLYDSYRNQVYLSAGDHIDVFSLATHNFSAPIQVPSNSGKRQVLGMALTPDGSKLLATNFSDFSLAIINADDPGTGAVAVDLTIAGTGPFQVAATSTKQAFVACGTVYMVDLSTLVVNPASPTFTLSFMQGSADGQVIVAAGANGSGGPLMSWQAATNMWQFELVGFTGIPHTQFWDDIAISGDGNVFAASSDVDSDFPLPYIGDANLRLTAQVNNPEFQAIAEGPSVQIDQSGALLYAITDDGVDIIDTRTGQLRERVILGEQILNAFVKTFAITPAGDQIVLLTTSGLTVVQLDSVPLGIGSVTPSAGSGGTVVAIRGTGFVAGTSVSVGGVSAASSLEDTSTLKVTIPTSAAMGAAQFVLANPDGSKFTLDAAFLVN
jgi:hypothetical protein